MDLAAAPAQEQAPAPAPAPSAPPPPPPPNFADLPPAVVVRVAELLAADAGHDSMASGDEAALVGVCAAWRAAAEPALRARLDFRASCGRMRRAAAASLEALRALVASLPGGARTFAEIAELDADVARQAAAGAGPGTDSDSERPPGPGEAAGGPGAGDAGGA